MSCNRPAKSIPNINVMLMSLLWLYKFFSPRSHCLCVVRWRDGWWPGQVSNSALYSPTLLLSCRGGGALLLPIAWAGVCFVALQHVLGIGGGGGEVLRSGDWLQASRHEGCFWCNYIKLAWQFCFSSTFTFIPIVKGKLDFPTDSIYVANLPH